MKCTTCNINWACLWSYQTDEECYEACPLCGSDMNLMESNEPAFIRCPFSGKVTNVETGELLTVETPESNYEPMKHKTWMELWVEDQQRQAKEAMALDAYHKALEKGQDGQKAFFDTHQELRSKEMFHNEREEMIPDYD